MEPKMFGITIPDQEANPVLICFDPGVYEMNEDDLLNLEVHFTSMTSRRAILDTSLGGDGILRIFFNEAMEQKISREDAVKIVTDWIEFAGEGFDINQMAEGLIE